MTLTHGVLLTVAYNGTHFKGYAQQANGRTVAGELLGAIRSIDPHASDVRGASRTDSGVHAQDQKIAFDTARDITPRSWVLGLSQHCADDLSVMHAARVPLGYDPRRTARRKFYRYIVLRSPVRDALWRHRAWQVRDRLNHERMRTAAASLVGTHDFGAFRSSRDARTETVRTLLRVDVIESPVDSRCLWIEVEGDRFLYRMVRVIAGTLVDIGRGARDLGCIPKAFASHDRNDLGPTAPADGLYLQRIDLDVSSDDEWPNQSSPPKRE